MKLALSSNGFKSISRPTPSFFSTQTIASTPPKFKRDTLYSRISPLGSPAASILPVLNQWVEEGKPVERTQTVHLIKQLRLFRRYKHALEVSQWMSDKRYFKLSPGDVAVRLDLISKVHGIEQAEKYFNNIAKQYKVYPVYGALLNCYARWKMIEKAEALMQQMRELKFDMAPLTYNVLLNLYSQVEQYEKLDTLMEEMKENGVNWDTFTFSIRISAYAATSDIDGMERTFHTMLEDPNVILDWGSYAIAANGYIKAGFIEKALELLKESEKMIIIKRKGSAYDHLITLYAGAGSKTDMYRIWKLYKSSGKLYNEAYISMIGSLLKLGDIAGAENILEEWESGDTAYDFRIPNLLVAFYCKNDLVEKAEKFIMKVIEKGKKPYPNTFDCLATGFVKADQMLKAVKTMKAAFLSGRPGWKPNCETVASCLVYLKQQGNLEEAEECRKLVVSGGYLSTDHCERVNDIFLHKTTESPTVTEI